MDCMDVSLAKKKGRFGGGEGTRCLLPSGSNWGKGMGMLEPVLVSGVLLLVGNSFVVSVWKYVEMGSLATQSWLCR